MKKSRTTFQRNGGSFSEGIMCKECGWDLWDNGYYVERMSLVPALKCTHCGDVIEKPNNIRGTANNENP